MKIVRNKKLAVIINFIIFKHKCHDISRGHQIEIVVHWPVGFGKWVVGRDLEWWEREWTEGERRSGGHLSREWLVVV